MSENETAGVLPEDFAGVLSASAGFPTQRNLCHPQSVLVAPKPVHRRLV